MKAAWHGWGLIYAAVLASCAMNNEKFLDLENCDYTISRGPHVFFDNRPLVKITRGDRTFWALADTGASRSLVVVPDEVHRAASLSANTEWIGVQGDSLKGVPVQLWINSTAHPGFAVAANKVPWSSQFPLILGLDVLRTHHVIFDYANRITHWGDASSSRSEQPISPELYVLPTGDDRKWIILDTGAINSYYLKGREKVTWEMEGSKTQLRNIKASKISQDIQSGSTRVGVLGMDHQIRFFRDFSTATGVARKNQPPDF